MGEFSEEGKKEIAEAVRILREDGVHIHKTYVAFQKSLETKPEPEGEAEPPGEGDPPPVKEGKPVVKEEYGLWGKKRVRE